MAHVCVQIFLFLLCNPYITLQNPTYYTVFEFILPGIQSSLEYFLFTSPMLLPRIDDGFSNPICVPGGFPFASQRFRVIYVSIISIDFALILHPVSFSCEYNMLYVLFGLLGNFSGFSFSSFLASFFWLYTYFHVYN